MKNFSLSGMIGICWATGRSNSLKLRHPCCRRYSKATTRCFTQPWEATNISEDSFLHQVEVTTQNVLLAHSQLIQKDDILNLPGHAREAVGIARHLDTRLQAFRRNNDCPRCWMQRAHCICSQCPPVPIPAPIRRIFLIVHHKEIALKVDTAKLILAAFPQECRLVVGGIGPEYQDSMQEMLSAIEQAPHRCLLLFPDETATTYEDLLEELRLDCSTKEDEDIGWDLIVLDGTWAQARKFSQRYFPEGGPRRVQLSVEAVERLDQNVGESVDGHQLRRHSIAWRQIGTFEATRLFLRDVDMAHGTAPNGGDTSWAKIQSYQVIANRAAQRELGPPRISYR